MKVLFVVNGEVFGGAERVQDLLGERLVNVAGFDVDVAMIKKGCYQDRSGISGLVSFYDCSSKTIRSLFQVLEKQYDIVHCHTPMSLIFYKIAAVFSKTSAKCIYHVHSPVLYDTHNATKNKIKYYIEKFSLSLSRDRVVFVSESVKRKTPYSDSILRSYTIHNGVKSVDVFGRAGCLDVVSLGFAGLIRPRKGLDVLIKAIGMLKREGINFCLNIYGDFDDVEYEKIILNLIKSNAVENSIIFHGFVSNIVDCLDKEVDIFVIPSLYGEGLPMVLLEAMSVAKIVVASDVDGIPEAIVSGENGFLVEPNNEQALYHSLKRVIEDRTLCNDLASKALVRQRTMFSSDSMASKIRGVYES